MARSKVKPAAASEPVEGPWALPEGWCWQRLGDAVEVHDNLRRPLNQSERNARLHHNPDAELYPYYGATGQVGEIDGYLADGEYVLLGEDGAPFLDRDKNKAYLVAGRFWANNHAHVLRAGKLFGNRWLLHWLNTIDYRGIVNGTTRLKLTQGAMNEMPVPVPLAGREEQIIARIDELFTEADDGEAALERARGDLAKWRKALLKAAVTGELTADWRAANPPTETGADLLARILAERRTRWLADRRNKGKRYVEPEWPDTTELFELPREWTWATVGQLGEVVTGATPATSDPEHYTGDIPFFTPGDLDAGFRLSSTKRTISQKGVDSIRPVPARSVLVTCIGATIGKVGFNSEAGATNQQINSIIPLVPSLAGYIFHYFDGPGRHLVIDGSSSTTMPILNKGDFTRLPVPLPPLNEAQEIASLVEAQNDQGNEAASDMADCRMAAPTLRQSILAAAFRGDLVQ